MSEPTFLDLNYFWEEILKVWVILARPAVQGQLLAIIASCLLSWLISRKLWHTIQKKFPNVSQLQFGKQRINRQEYGAALGQFLLMPTLSLIFLLLLNFFFKQQGWFSGYIDNSLKIVLDLILFRTFITTLYALFPVDAVRYYQFRFFAPLFVLFIVTRILNWFVNLQNLFQVSLFKVFGEPLTIEMIFVTFAGLYFWLVGLSLIEKICVQFLTWIRGEEVLIDQAISLLLRYFLIALGIVLIAGYIGISPTAIAAVTGGLSVGIGFGLKEVISNFVSGIWLLFEGALKPGDVVMIEGNMSRVTKLGIRATTVQSVKDNSETIIPNQTFFTDKITTLTGSDRLIRRSVIIGASYKCDPQKVLNVILQVAHQHPKVMQLPAPVAFAINFGESSVDYELLFWLNEPMIHLTVTSELICEVWQAFADNNIEIPFPQRDIHIRQD